MRLFEIYLGLGFVLSTGLLFPSVRGNKLWLSLAVMLAVASSLFTIHQIYGHLYPVQQTLEDGLRLERERLARQFEQQRLKHEQELADLRKRQQEEHQRALDELREQRERERLAFELEQRRLQEERERAGNIKPVADKPADDTHDQMKQLAVGVISGVFQLMMGKLEKELGR